MPKIDGLKNLVCEQLHELKIERNAVKVLYDEEAKEYYQNIGKLKKGFRGYIDIDSYFESPIKPINVLIFNSDNKYVYGTIAHELEHVKQLLAGRIRQNTDRGKFRCEVGAYKAGRIELGKYNKMLSLFYSMDSWGSLCKHFFKYELIGRIKRDKS